MVNVSKVRRDVDLSRRSAFFVIESAHRNAKTFDKLWRIARNAPFLQKRIVKKNADGSSRRVMRPNRLVSSHAFKILASGAALNVANTLKQDADTLRIPIGTPDNPGELRSAAWLPGIGAPTTHLFEQFLAAYVQQSVMKAVDIKNSFGKHHKITKKCMQLAMQATNESIFGTGMASGPVIQDTNKAAAPPASKESKKSEASKNKAAVDDGAAEASV